MRRPTQSTRTPPTERRSGHGSGLGRRRDQQHDHLHVWTTTLAGGSRLTDQPAWSRSPTARCSIAKRRPVTTSRCEPPAATAVHNTQVMTININDVDEFDVGPITDSDAAANAVDENAANGTAVGRDGIGVAMLTRRTTRSPTRWTMTLADGSRSTAQPVWSLSPTARAGSRSGSQSQHHGAGRQQRRQFQHASDDDQHQRRR